MGKIHRGDGFAIIETDGEYKISWAQGPYNEPISYQISKRNMEKALKSSQDAYEVMIYAETEQWSSGVDEEEDIHKAIVKKAPELLLKVPENQELFTKSELDKLLPLAKKAIRESDN